MPAKFGTATINDLEDTLARNLKNGQTLTNSEDPDEMQHDAAFHQGLHCL